MSASKKIYVKCVIITLSLFLLIAGMAALITGIWMLTADTSLLHRYIDVIATNHDVRVTILKNGVIALTAGGLGVVMFASIGIVAAATSSTGVLAMYSVFLAVLMVIGVTPVVLAIDFRDEWELRIDREVMTSLLTHYGDRYSEKGRSFTSSFDALQYDYSCCGWYNVSDYYSDSNNNNNNNNNNNSGETAVHESCCISAHNITYAPQDKCVKGQVTSQVFNTTGCRNVMVHLLTLYELILISVSVVILGFELASLAGAVSLLAIEASFDYDLG